MLHRLVLGLVGLLFGGVWAGAATHSAQAYNDTALVLLKHDPEAALFWASEALRLAQSQQDDSGARDALSLQGFAWKRLGNVDSAIACHSMRLQLEQKLSDTSGIARTKMELGNLYIKRGDFFLGERSLQQALATFLRQEDTLFVAQGYNNLGKFYRKKSGPDIDTTRWYHEQAIIYFEMAGESPANGYFSLGNYYVIVERYETAFAYYRKAIKDYQERGNILEETRLRSSMAVILREDPDSIHRAEEEYRKCLEAHISLHNPSGEAYSHQGLGETYMGMEKFEKARFHLNEARLLARSIPLVALESSVQNLLVTLAALEKKAAADRIKTFGLFALGLIFLGAVFSLYQRERRVSAQRLAAAKAKAEKQGLLDEIKSKEVQALEAGFHGQAQERHRIARDLHDQLGSMLSTVKLYYGVVEKKLPAKDEALSQDLQKLEHLIDSACDEVRRVSHDLRQDRFSNAGFEKALENLASTLRGTGNYDVELDLHLGSSELPGPVVRNLLFVSQELVTNTVKYAQAKSIGLQVVVNKDDLQFHYEDDGQGFDANVTRNGIGMANMKERIAALQGEFHLDTHLGRGTSVVISIPLVTQAV